MTHRRLFVVVIAISVLGISALVASSLRTPAPGAKARTYYAHTYVPQTGTYDVVTQVLGGPTAQSVTLSVAGAATRTVPIPSGGDTSFAVAARLKRGALVVRAVGAHFRPSAQVTLYDPATAADVGAHAPTVQPYTRLVWSDDFNGPAGARPTAAKWTRDAGPYGALDHELEYYSDSPANASLDGHGDLAIVARHQTIRAGGASWHFTSARLETQGTFSPTYGLIEARMKVPAGFGLWSSFWMLGSNFNAVGWPRCGELDVMETVGQYPFSVRSTIHGPAGASSYSRGQDFLSTSSLASGFHTYAVSWSPNSITWLIDGVPYASATPADLTPGQRWVFNHPFHLVLNLAVGGHWPGPPNAFTPFPAKLMVDWVRVYQ
ncbi:MAG TPA: glycoside hydrolase family 16 protein [Solirubrobacteraceae bacterium]